MDCNKKREVSRFQATKTGDLKSPDSCICISLSSLFWYFGIILLAEKHYFLFVSSFFLFLNE